MRMTRWWGVLLTAVALVPVSLSGQTDEIQVYDGSLAPVGVLNLTLHDNYTPDGRKTPAFPGAVISNHSLNGVPEWAYGVTPWFEAGLYLPIYSIEQKRGASLDGFKLRALFAVPHAAQRRFFYGVNFEFSYNARWWDPNRFTSEVRPIVGWHLSPVDVILNPILDTSYDGGFGGLDFAPCARLALNISTAWAVAMEEYGDFGPIHAFDPVTRQLQQLFAVVDRDSRVLDVEAGVGFGLTKGSDDTTLKLILSRDLD